jgi:hypothetical protein
MEATRPARAHAVHAVRVQGSNWEDHEVTDDAEEPKMDLAAILRAMDPTAFKAKPDELYRGALERIRFVMPMTRGARGQLGRPANGSRSLSHSVTPSDWQQTDGPSRKPHNASPTAGTSNPARSTRFSRVLDVTRSPEAVRPCPPPRHTDGCNSRRNRFIRSCHQHRT